MKAIDGLLAFIASQQQEDGSFLSFSSPDRDGGSEGVPYRTTFLTSQIVAALAAADDERARGIVRQGASFLRGQFRDGSVNYWVRDSAESVSMRLPDDLDDTACAAAALFLADDAFKADGDLLGGLTRTLVDTECEAGGPYFTWRIGAQAEARWKDVDPAVNANVAFALDLVGVRLANLDRYLIARLAEGRIHSPYYPDALACLYFLSRLPRLALSESIHKGLEALRLPDGGWGSGLRDAMAVSAFLRTDGVSHVVPRLLEALGDLSTLKPSAFCLDPAQQGVTHYAGSRALDAAFRLEALTLATRDTRSTPETDIQPSPEEWSMHRQIMEAAHQALPEGLLGEGMAKLLRRIERFDAGKNITLTPWRFGLALGGEHDDAFVKALGLANVFGWAAYTAYDDILDGDGSGELVSPANAFLRRLNDTLMNILPTHAAFQTWWRSVMDRVDEANAWELAFCRFAPGSALPKPELTVADALFFSERSLGHAIGPVALMCANGFDLESVQTQSALEAFRCYLTARQMHDDAHDWQEDLKRGQLNSASLRLLRSTTATTFDEARIDFWTRGILEHAEAINEVCRRGHAAIDACAAIKHADGLHRLFVKIETGTKQALDGRERTLAFLKSFRPS
jgi:hypothetical protein